MRKFALLIKSKTIHSGKTVSQFSLKPWKTIAHDTIKWLKNIVQYLNTKMKDVLVEVFDLQLFSSLKWDGV